MSRHNQDLRTLEAHGQPACMVGAFTPALPSEEWDHLQPLTKSCRTDVPP